MLEPTIASHAATFSAPESGAAERSWTERFSDSLRGTSHHRKYDTSHRRMPACDYAFASVAEGTRFVFASLGVICKITNPSFSMLFEFAGHRLSLSGQTVGDATKVAKPVAARTKMAVFGNFYEEEWSDPAVDLISASGFLNEDVCALWPEILCSKDLAHVRDARAGNSTAVDGTLGLVVGIGFAAIRDALAGMGAGGLVGGSIDAVVAAGRPNLETKCTEWHVAVVDTLVTVYRHTPEQIACARELALQTGDRVIASSDQPTAELRTAVLVGTRQE